MLHRCYVFHKSNARPSTSTKVTTCFIAVVWSRTLNPRYACMHTVKDIICPLRLGPLGEPCKWCAQTPGPRGVRSWRCSACCFPRPQAHLLPFPAFSPLEPSHTQIASGPLHVRTPNQTESSDPPNRPWLERKGSGCVSGHAGCADSSRPDSLVLTSVVMVGLCSPAVCALTRHLAVDLVPVSPTEKTGGRTGQCGRLLPQPPPPLCTPC